MKRENNRVMNVEKKTRKSILTNRHRRGIPVFLSIFFLVVIQVVTLTGCSPGELADSMVNKIANKGLEEHRQQMAESTTAAPEPESYYVRTKIPLRSEISISTEAEIAVLEPNQLVYLLSTEKSWSKIRTEDGLEGYIMSMHLSETEVKVVDEKDTHWEYERDGLTIEINKKTDNHIVYWVANIYTENPDEDINTAFAGGSYESCMTTKEEVSALAEEHSAIFAINGDAVGFRGDDSDASDFKNPIVIRNGELCYEDNRDIGKMCALMKNGKLKIFSPKDLGSGSQMVEDGVTDVWWFDTPLVENGSVVPTLYEVEESLDIAPYTAIGQKDKNNFIFIVVDGRGSSGSPGVTYTRMAEYMEAEGAKTAYQLDGGGSSEMWFDGMVLNQPSDGYERPISDIVYIKK
ncbi:MAG: phosphodiester glycosidase family protein [Lachnospiraceae bacterium]|nr:phosphodiester glycosidase family protein [Lachnospiraceae bacterium]